MSSTDKQWTVAAVLAERTRNHTRLQVLGVRSLGLFGSYRRGTQRADSDIDFLVDLVLVETLKPQLRAVILHEVVYAEGVSPLPGKPPRDDRQD